MLISIGIRSKENLSAILIAGLIQTFSLTIYFSSIYSAGVNINGALLGPMVLTAIFLSFMGTLLFDSVRYVGIEFAYQSQLSCLVGSMLFPVLLVTSFFIFQDKIPSDGPVKGVFLTWLMLVIASVWGSTMLAKWENGAHHSYVLHFIFFAIGPFLYPIWMYTSWRVFAGAILLQLILGTILFLKFSKVPTPEAIPA